MPRNALRSSEATMISAIQNFQPNPTDLADLAAGVGEGAGVSTATACSEAAAGRPSMTLRVASSTTTSEGSRTSESMALRPWLISRSLFGE